MLISLYLSTCFRHNIKSIVMTPYVYNYYVCYLVSRVIKKYENHIMKPYRFLTILFSCAHGVLFWAMPIKTRVMVPYVFKE